MPKCGLVTVLFNSTPFLADFIACLSAQTFTDFRLYAIDNASTDDSTLIANSLIQYDGLNGLVFQNTENLGVATANNQGIRMALDEGCDYVILLNNDIVFGERTLEKVIERADLADADAIAPKVLYYDTRRVWFGGGAFSRVKGVNVHVGRGCGKISRYKQERLIGYAPTCFVLFKSSVFARIGLMDESYFVYFDDTDFMYRMAMTDIPLLYFPAVEILHKASSSTGGNESDFSLRYLSRNRVIFLRKFYPAVLTLFYLGVFLASKIPLAWRLDSRRRKIFLSGFAEGLQMPLGIHRNRTKTERRV